MSESNWNFTEWESALGLSADDMEENIRGTDEVKLTTKLNRTEEEIEKYSVDESFDIIEKSEYLLKHGAPVQKIWVVNNLSSLIKESISSGKLEHVKSKVFQNLVQVLNTKEAAPYQSTIGNILAEMMEKAEAPLPSKLLQVLLPLCLKLMQSKSEDTVKSWAQVTLASIRHLPPAVIEEEVLPDTLFRTSMSPLPSTVRIFSCKIMGAAAQRLSAERIESLFLRKAMALCQDTNYEVRKVMCSQIPAIAASISPNCIKTTLLDEVAELYEDEEAVVREAMVHHTPSILTYFDDEPKVKILLPIWKKLCEDKHLLVQRAVAQNFGHFFVEFQSNLSSTDYDQVYTYFCKFALHQDPVVRASAVYNMPCVLKIAGVEKAISLPLDEFFTKWSAADASPIVKSNFKKCIHECAHYLGKHAAKLLKSPLKQLLASPHELAPSPSLVIEQTVEPLFVNLSKTLCHLAASVDGKVSQLSSILPVIIGKHKELQSKGYRYWRLEEQLIKTFASFPSCFPQDDVFEFCTPLLLNITSQSSVIVLKKVAISVLCSLMRFLRRIDHREFIWRQMYDRLRSKAFQDRLLYLSFAQCVLETCSKPVFKDHFLINVFELSRDKVANVRLKVCELLGPIRSTLRAPGDSSLIQRYNEVVRVLCTLERDQDVVKAATRVNQGNQLADSPDSKALLDQQNRQRELEEEAMLAAERSEDNAAGLASEAPSQPSVGSNHGKRMLHGNPSPWSGHVPSGLQCLNSGVVQKPGMSENATNPSGSSPKSQASVSSTSSALASGSSGSLSSNVNLAGANIKNKKLNLSSTSLSSSLPVNNSNTSSSLNSINSILKKIPATSSVTSTQQGANSYTSSSTNSVGGGSTTKAGLAKTTSQTTPRSSVTSRSTTEKTLSESYAKRK